MTTAKAKPKTKTVPKAKGFIELPAPKGPGKAIRTMGHQKAKSNREQSNAQKPLTAQEVIEESIAKSKLRIQVIKDRKREELNDIKKSTIRRIINNMSI